MSRAVHQFFSLLRDDEDNDTINDAWDDLSVHDRLEAIDLADTGEYALLSGGVRDNSERELELALT